ncbi:hypothetical protein PV327_004733 [Microctonus hyperodae]|uniref:RRM domain-containing protein n=1 Tax=Microctonus hyperodae TaxID=165561 RepID=A0AA39KMU4_MICHY|nr:hypothetical protein PV327_004733 [Microctonus hyperodae]
MNSIGQHKRDGSIVGCKIAQQERILVRVDDDDDDDDAQYQTMDVMPWIRGGLASAVPLPPALHTNNPAAFTGGHHLFGQQGCSLACTCTCTCTASIVSAAAAAAHHPQLHQHHRALGTASATVLLQPVDQIKDAMAKLDKSHNGKPSRVIHIRNIASDVSESEIIHLGLPFGRVTNVLVLKGKNQALIEMADENAATTMVGYYAASGASLRGRAVYVQFSNHRELKTDQAHSNAVSSSTTNIIANASNTGCRGERKIEQTT